jgi:hypothetical protein
VSELQPRTRADALVRPFVMTGGRTQASDASLRMETIVHAAADVPGTGTFESARIVELCAQPHSVAEIAAKVPLPLGVAMVLVGDLVAQRRLVVHHTDPIDIELSALTRMINRVRTL